MALEIRPSTVGSMMLCPARTMLRDEPIIPAEALVFGSLVHWRIEQELADERVTVSDIHDALDGIFYEDTEQTVQIHEVAGTKQRAQLVNETTAALAQWKSQVQPFLPGSEATVEQKLRTTIGIHPVTNEAVEMFGTPDVVYHDERLIVDWKTAGKQWDKHKMQGQVQPMAYNALVDMPEAYQFQFYVYDRAKSSWMLHDYGTPSLRSIDVFIEQAYAMALLTEGEPVYLPGGQGWSARGWHCSPKYCDVWGKCEGRRLIKDGKEMKRAAKSSEKGWTK